MADAHPNSARVVFAAFLGWAANELHRRPSAALYEAPVDAGHALYREEPETEIEVYSAPICAICDECVAAEASWCYEEGYFYCGLIVEVLVFVVTLWILICFPTRRVARRRARVLHQ